MNRKSAAVLAALMVFLVLAALYGSLPNSREAPYSSFSAAPAGTKAAYLLLEELGFRVARNTSADWDGQGTRLALGPEYLPHGEGAITLPMDYRFTNEMIEHNAEAFVQLLWPHRDQLIVFEEYRREEFPIAAGAQGQELTLGRLLPGWFEPFLANLVLAALFVLLFQGQRMGEPAVPEAFSGRRPLEGVEAMARALQRAQTYRDCVRAYYHYRCRSGDQWDAGGRIGLALESVDSERAALALMDEMDQRSEEFRHEDN